MILNIKNMASQRCKILVEDVLNKNEISCISVKLGQVETIEDVSGEPYKGINSELLQSGLEIIEDKKDVLVEKIKSTIIELIHESEGRPKTSYSNYLSTQLKHNYAYLSKLFSDSEGMTIEQFIIIHKVERVKELISYDELNINQIAFKLHYSSAAHLTKQFKKVTGGNSFRFQNAKRKNTDQLRELIRRKKF